MINVCGHRVLLKPKDVEKVTKGGIYIPDNVADKEARATTVGTVINVGPTAWHDFPGDPWCKEGDVVLYGKYGGKIVEDPNTKEKYVVCNDEDIICILKGEIVEHE